MTITTSCWPWWRRCHCAAGSLICCAPFCSEIHLSLKCHSFSEEFELAYFQLHSLRSMFLTSVEFNCFWLTILSDGNIKHKLSASRPTMASTILWIHLRNRRWRGSVYVLHVFFLLFFRPSNMRQPFSGTAERIFMKLLPNDTGENVVWNVVPPLGESRAAAWRMLMICVNLRYDSFAITRGRHVI